MNRIRETEDLFNGIMYLCQDQELQITIVALAKIITIFIENAPDDESKRWFVKNIFCFPLLIEYSNTRNLPHEKIMEKFEEGNKHIDVLINQFIALGKDGG